MLVYDRRCTAPEKIAARLGIGTFVNYAPVGVHLPVEGWCVVRRTWAGIDVLYPPVTPELIDALPDPGVDPAELAAVEAAAITGVLETLRNTSIDAVRLNTDLEALRTYMELPAPTAAEAIDATRVTIRVLADVIRYILR